MSPNAWREVVADAITAEIVDALVLAEIPYAVLPGFFTPAWCGEIARRFGERIRAGGGFEVPYYDDMRIATLAKTLEMVSGTDEDYFALAVAAAPEMRALYEGGRDPLAELSSMLALAGWRVGAAGAPDRPYLTDLVWSLPPGTISPIHADTFLLYVKQEPSRFPVRLSWNVFLETPEGGGEFVIYRRRHEERDNVHRIRRGQVGLHRDVIEGAPSAEYQPGLGDLVLFDSYLYHEVRPSRGACRRTTAHATIGLLPSTREAAFFV